MQNAMQLTQFKGDIDMIGNRKTHGGDVDCRANFGLRERLEKMGILFPYFIRPFTPNARGELIG